MINETNNVKYSKRFSFYHDPSVESLKRSVLKMISFELLLGCLNFLAVYLITGRARIALGFVVICGIYSMISFFIHERIWDKIKWGKINEF